jgi:hypothetical protein
VAARDSFPIGWTRLSLLVDSTVDDPELWRPEEFGAIFRHQLTASLCIELASLAPDIEEKLAGLLMPDGRPVASFGDLLGLPAPPVALLEMVKEFAKASRRPGRCQLPPDVATMLYYLAIGAALFRCGCRLTRLSDSILWDGLRWAGAQPWADTAIRDLLRRAAACVSPDMPATAPGAAASPASPPAARRFRKA